MVFGNRKGGSSRLRAQRARKGHARRRARGTTVTGIGSHYKGSKKNRIKPAWWQ